MADSVLTEVLDRTRRIETRLTKYMEATGFDTKVRRPTFANGIINVPTPATSLKDCLSVIPHDWRTPVTVIHKSDKLVTLVINPV